MTSSTSKHTHFPKKEQPDSDYYRQYQNAVKALDLIEGEREAQQQERFRQSLLELVALKKQFQPLFQRRNQQLRRLRSL